MFFSIPFPYDGTPQKAQGSDKTVRESSIDTARIMRHSLIHQAPGSKIHKVDQFKPSQAKQKVCRTKKLQIIDSTRQRYMQPSFKKLGQVLLDKCGGAHPLSELFPAIRCEVTDRATHPAAIIAPVAVVYREMVGNLV